VRAARVSLTRHGRVYARGHVNRRGRLRLTATRRMHKGDYVLRILGMKVRVTVG
jgi:hypothetical protein